MAVLPQFTPFNHTSKTWDSYIVQFECILEANDFMNIMSYSDGQSSPCSPISADGTMGHPTREAKGPLCTEAFLHHPLTPFHHWNQAEGESINKYMAALQKAALYCEFHDLDNALLDRLVCEVRDIKFQLCLLMRQNLMLQMMMEEAQAAETSTQSMAEIQKLNNPSTSQKMVLVHHEEVDQRGSTDEEENEDVHRLKATNKGCNMAIEKKPSACMGCGRNHPQAMCKYKNIIYQWCNKKEHLA
ncbi:hypothetical protein E2320_002339 [Naja naja]|nr:hypothetical protein E2320_002339 [Naja naja]